MLNLLRKSFFVAEVPETIVGLSAKMLAKGWTPDYCNCYSENDNLRLKRTQLVADLKDALGFEGTLEEFCSAYAYAGLCCEKHETVRVDSPIVAHFGWRDGSKQCRKLIDVISSIAFKRFRDEFAKKMAANLSGDSL